MLLVVRVKVSAKIPEELRDAMQERAAFEGRSFSNMLERLVGLGLGTVVSEAGVTHPAGNGGEVYRGSIPLVTAPVSLTAANCPVRQNHRSGSQCNTCKAVFPSKEVTPDPRGK